ncbi:hypothetical protein [Tahibacter amnicola]|uniref:Uncharacterized protein n=1 Tax=Tahibacter amnicola TaxID=2976241 RepID=A0ABY6BGV3_9GAMM|nr:hypothetical protein [Tahibacter amnicola]UXI69258.1 hypothetical protein N4264_06305 [Tahibacter amnicola]
MFQAIFRLPRTRNPLARAVFAVLGALVLAGVLVFGFFALVLLVCVGAVIWLARHLAGPRAPAATATASAGTPPPSRQTPAGVIEGEFVVVDESATTRQQR